MHEYGHGTFTYDSNGNAASWEGDFRITDGRPSNGSSSSARTPRGYIQISLLASDVAFELPEGLPRSVWATLEQDQKLDLTSSAAPGSPCSGERAEHVKTVLQSWCQVLADQVRGRRLQLTLERAWVHGDEGFPRVRLRCGVQPAGGEVDEAERLARTGTGLSGCELRDLQSYEGARQDTFRTNDTELSD